MGLATIEEAVRVYRRLAASNPAAHERALATSANNLADQLVVMGREAAAERAREEATAPAARNASALAPRWHAR